MCLSIILSCGNTVQQCRLRLFQDSDFARDVEYSKSTSGGTLFFSEITRLCQQVGCARNRFQFHTALQKLNFFFVGCRIKDGRYQRIDWEQMEFSLYKFHKIHNIGNSRRDSEDHDYWIEV